MSRARGESRVRARSSAAVRSEVVKAVLWPARAAAWLVWLPIRGLLGFRRSLTGASATLLFFTVLSLNIVWGYPWVGVFSACVSLLVIGWLVNRLFAPRLQVGFSLPASATAGESWPVRQHLENVGRLPAMELRVRFDQPKRRAIGRRDVWRYDQPCRVVRIPARGRAAVSRTLRVEERGVWRVPDLVVESLFPFFLFRVTRRVVSDATIPITPRLLHVSEEPAIRTALTAVSGWATQQSAGSSMEYVGSREYQTGMPVRRWDFVSWARLGRPIVREYTSPSLHTITIVVDTGTDTGGRFRGRSGRARALEHVLSVAATVLVERGRGDVGFQMFVTGPSNDGKGRGGGRQRDGKRDLRECEVIVSSPGDIEPLLIRLASADAVSAEVADEQVTAFLAKTVRSETLVLTTREQPAFLRWGVGRMSVVRVGREMAAIADEESGDGKPGDGESPGGNGEGGKGSGGESDAVGSATSAGSPSGVGRWGVASSGLGERS